MKKVLILLFCLYSISAYSQTALKVNVPDGKAVPKDPVVKKSADSLRNAMDTFKSKPSGLNFINLVDIANSPNLLPLAFLPPIKKTIGTSKDTTLLTADGLQKIADQLDTAVIKPDTAVELCPRIKDATIKFILDANDNYLGVIEDTTGNALESFSLLQSNKELFYDKLEKAFAALCNKDVAKEIIQRFKTENPDLYTQFLEKKEDLANTNGLAGILKIYKNTLVRRTDDRSGSGQQKGQRASTIENIIAAKQEAEQSLALAKQLMIQVDAIEKEVSADTAARINKTWVQFIQTTAAESRNAVQNAGHYYDSIRQGMPNDKLLRSYDTVIQLSDRAQLEAKKAMRSIKYAQRQMRKLPVSGPSDEEYSLLPEDIEFSFTEYEPARTDTTPAGQFRIGDIPNFTIQSIQIQFEDGFIENIKVFGKLKDSTHLFRFENIYPIGFSTKRDFRNLIDIRLYEKSNFHRYSNMYINLGELIGYDQNLANYNKDYSPVNQVITIKALTDSIKEIPLYKDQTSKILELQVFSDLKGADDDNPNGLIQLSLSKKLNFFSYRMPFSGVIWPWHWWWALPWKWGSFQTEKEKHKYENLGNVGFFNYVTPVFTLDKIENNNKRLILDRIDSLSNTADTSRPITYTSTIRLLQHQLFTIGFDASILLVDVPNIKSTFNLGAGFRYGRVSIQDTLRVRTANKTPLDFHAAETNNVLQYGVNTFQWGPFLTWQIFPDSRYGFNITQRLNWFKAPTDNFVQVRDSAHFLKFIGKGPSGPVRTTPYTYYDYSHSNWLAERFSLFTKAVASTEISAYFYPNTDGSNKLFFRYRFNWDVGNARENFYQLQVGFSTYLSATKAYSKLKKNANTE